MSPAAKTVTLCSSDNERLEVDAAVALQSETIARMNTINSSRLKWIPVVTVSGHLLRKAMEYCAIQAEKDSLGMEELEAGEEKITEDMPLMTVPDFIAAAADLGIPSLVDRACRALREKAPVGCF